MVWRRRFPRLSKDFQVTYRMVDQEKFDVTAQVHQEVNHALVQGR